MTSTSAVPLWLVATLKGGVRKSTTVMMTAFALAARGEDVLVVDADPGSQGVTDWGSQVYAAGGELPFDVVQWAPSQGLLVPFVQQAQRRTGARRTLVDVGGEAPEVLRQGVLIASQVISPTGAEKGELGRIPATALIVREYGVPMAALLTRVPTAGVGSARQARDRLEGQGHEVLDTEIPHNKSVYAHVWGTVPADTGAYDDLAAEMLKREAA